MNLIDAIKSGKPFRQSDDPSACWIYIQNTQAWFTDRLGDRHQMRFGAYDIIEQDWEVQEPEVKLTRTRLLEVWEEALYEVEAEQSGIQVFPGWEHALLTQKSVTKLLDKLFSEEGSRD